MKYVVSIGFKRSLFFYHRNSMRDSMGRWRPVLFVCVLGLMIGLFPSISSAKRVYVDFRLQ